MSQPPDPTTPGPARETRAARSLFPWAVAACLGLGVAEMTALYIGGRAENASLLEQERMADVELRSEHNQIEAERILAARELADVRGELTVSAGRIGELMRFIDAEGDPARLRISTLVPAAADAPRASAVAVWDPVCQKGVLEFSKLPAAARDRDYQLWLLGPEDQAPVSAGVVSVDSTGGGRVTFKSATPVRRPARFVISLEPRGGSPEQQGPVVMIGF